jgi:hypothetical protein
VNLVLGVWLFISPWALRFWGTMPGSSGNFLMVGVALVVFALVGLNARGLWQEWVNLVLGIWLIVSPWLLGFHTHAVARDDAIVVGIVTAVVALWALLERHRIGATNEAAAHSLTH